jgi:predicted Zn-dependent protease with MMP-like domain/Flp pilus assembly protein TadD
MSETGDRDPELDLLEAIYDALDEEQPQRALALAREALSGGDEEDPVVCFLAGVALLELDEPERAADFLGRAVRIDPDDAEFRTNLALALYRCCRFAEAAVEAERAVESDPSLPDALFVQGLLLERQGPPGPADEAFRRAAELDPERFPPTSRLSDADFEHQIVRARASLPDEFARHLDAVAVTVEPLPSDEILLEEEPPMDPELFGLFVGVSLPDRSSFSPGGELPPRILLFKRNLERCFPEPAELVRQIAITLYHELGHYLGLDEDELEAIDLG